jgi:GNAT superfamily N-acetyltransferase
VPGGLRITEGDMHCLGVTADADSVDYAVGILAFSLEEGIGEDTNMTMAVINWLYVSPLFRRSGAGALLLDALFDILYRVNAFESGEFIDGIICDIPLDDTYDELCAFFEVFGFGAGLVDIYSGNFILKDFSQHPKLQGKKIASDGLLPLSAVDPLLLSEYLAKAEEETDMLHSLSPDPDDYEKQLSFVSMKNREPDGLFLVHRSANTGILEPLYLRGANGRVCFDLVLSSIKAATAASERYPPETPVSINCVSGDSAAILADLFPDITPGLSRRMVYDLSEEAEETAEAE